MKENFVKIFIKSIKTIHFSFLFLVVRLNSSYVYVCLIIYYFIVYSNKMQLWFLGTKFRIDGSSERNANRFLRWKNSQYDFKLEGNCQKSNGRR